MVFGSQWKSRRFAVIISSVLVLFFGASRFFTDGSIDNQSKESSTILVKPLGDIAKQHQSILTNNEFIQSASIQSNTNLKQNKQ